MKDIANNFAEKLSEEGKKLKKEVKQKTLGYLTAGLGLVAGLAWNDAIRSLIEYFFPIDKNSVLAKFVFAGVITILLVVVSVYLIRLFKEEEK